MRGMKCLRILLMVDAGEARVSPLAFDGWLHTHSNVKSSARLLCPPERTHEYSGWDTPYVHDTVTVLSQHLGTAALGTAFGSCEHTNAPRLGIGACLR